MAISGSTRGGREAIAKSRAPARASVVGNGALPAVRNAADPMQALATASLALDPRSTDGAPRPQPLLQQSLLQLQRQYGNRHVAGILNRAHAASVVQRAAEGTVVQRECPPSAPERPTLAPGQDPDFSVTGARIKQTAKREREHTSAPAKAAETQAAAVAPSNEAAAEAKAAQVEKMARQQPGSFDKEGFIAAVRAAIEAATPKNLNEALSYAESGKAAQVKQQVSGLVGNNKQAAEQAIKAATDEAPDTDKARKVPSTPVKPEVAGPAPGPIAAGRAMPEPLPASSIDLRQNQCANDERMKEAGVTEAQLAKSNEPQFQAALGAKQAAEAETAKAPRDFRSQEQKLLGGAKAQATAFANQGVGRMHNGRAAALAGVAGSQRSGKAAEEAARAQLAGELETFYSSAKKDVTDILQGLSDKIGPMFDRGEQANREAMEAAIEADTELFKSNRSTLEWIEDKFSKPPELDAIIDKAVKQYLRRMDNLISRVADTVGAELARAKARIAQGRQEVATHVAGLRKTHRTLGNELLADFDDKFKGLVGEVDARRDAIVDSLAEKYVAARDAVNERATAMKEANKGVWDRVKEVVGEAVDTILKLKDMLFGVLAKAASVIDKIIADPIGFLGNMVAAIKQGLNQFAGRFVEHLEDGLKGWLFGTLAEGGVKAPESLDVKGVIGLVAELAGISYANIRSRAVNIIGAKGVEVLEKTVEVFQTLAKEGIGGIWRFIADGVGNLRETVLVEIKGFIATKVVSAGITWLLSMLNPASAFIRACKMIYDVVTFFIERGSQVKDLVTAVLDGVGDIASGVIAGAAAKVEGALVKALPLAISFLASLLGLGGIAEKIKSIIKAIQAPVQKAIDAVIGGALKLFKRLGGDKLIKAAEKGIAWGKEKIKKGKEWVNDKAIGARETATAAASPDARARLRGAVDEVAVLMRNDKATLQAIEAELPAIAVRYRLASLTLEPMHKRQYRPVARINPALPGPTEVLFSQPEIDALTQDAKVMASNIKSDPKKRAAFKADPMEFLRPAKKGKENVNIGDVVEAAGTPGLMEIAKEAGLTLIRGAHIQFYDAAGKPVGGAQAELDFLLLGDSEVKEIVSAKMEPKRISAATDRKALSHMQSIPTDPAALREFLTTPPSPFGDSPAYARVESARVKWIGGSAPLIDFRAKYLAQTVVTSVVVKGLTPAGTADKGYNLRQTEPELLAKLRSILMTMIS